MFSMKFGKDTVQDRRTGILRIIFLTAAVLTVCIVAAFRLHWSLAILIIFSIYIVMNIISPKQ